MTAMTTPFDAVVATSKAVANIGAKFMLDPSVYAKGDAEHGFHGMDFYFAGRCGVMGDVSSSTAAAAMGFFPPHVVEFMWGSGTSVMPASKAGELYVAACADWGREHLGADIDYAELASLTKRIVDHAPVSGLPLFAGWQTVKLPDDPKGAAMVALTALRELRGSAHTVAVLAAGIAPLEAVVATGGVPNAQLFGYGEPYPEVGHLREAMERVEEATNLIVAKGYDALTSAELDRFVELANAAYDGLS